jgi:hypothetical protein
MDARTNGDDMATVSFEFLGLPGCESTNRHAHSLDPWRLAFGVLAAFSLTAMLTACQSSAPVAPARVSTLETARPVEFSSEQRTRLDRLRRLVDEPLAPELSKGLVVRLAFEDVADLDLFVTDPTQESVYFANTPTRSGGALIEDRRCNDPGPRVEIVHFPNPIAGRYRVGVDFHRTCKADSSSSGAVEEALYLVRIDDGERALEHAGLLKPGVFEVIAIEFDIGAGVSGVSD